MISGTPLVLKATGGVGTNNWAMNRTAAAGDNLTSKCDFGTAATPVGFKPVRPGATTPTAVTPVASPAAAAQDFGWNITVADMDVPAGDVPGRRRVRSGSWVFNCVYEGSTADATTNFGIHARIYRRLAGGTFSAVLASGETIGLSMVAGTADVDIPVSLGTDQFFSAGETLHVEFWVKGRGGGATGLLPQVISFHVGIPTLRQATQVDLPGAGLTTVYDRSVTPVGTATVTRSMKVKLPRTFTATGLVDMTRLLTLRRTVSALSPGLVTRTLRVGKPLTFLATGQMTVTKKMSKTIDTVGVGITTLTKKLAKTLTALTSGTPTVTRQLSLHRTIEVISPGLATMDRRLVLRRLMDAVATGRVRAQAKLDFRNIPLSTGGTTIIKKIISIFDD